MLHISDFFFFFEALDIFLLHNNLKIYDAFLSFVKIKKILLIMNTLHTKNNSKYEAFSNWKTEFSLIEEKFRQINTTVRNYK